MQILLMASAVFQQVACQPGARGGDYRFVVVRWRDPRFRLALDPSPARGCPPDRHLLRKAEAERLAFLLGNAARDRTAAMRDGGYRASEHARRPASSGPPNRPSSAADS